MDIRLALESDVSAMSQVLKSLDTEHYTYSDEALISRGLEKKEYFVLIDEAHIVGVIMLVEDDQSLKIGSLASAASGGGKMMIDFAVQRCRELGFQKLWCWSLKEYDAVGFYQKLGFTESLLMEKQWYGQDCWILGRVFDDV